MSTPAARDARFRLALLTLLAFAPCVGNDFVDWDDPINIINNADLRTIGMYNWAWQTFLLGVYQPLAWILLGLQSLVWGLKPSGYHLVSVALHALNAVVMFDLIRALLARARPDWERDRPGALIVASGLATASFVAHPLRVEAVAWVSCQPYLPCALLAMLAVRAYLRAHPREGPTNWSWWLGSLGLFAAACLCKAVAAGVFVAFVVLDVYPLRRTASGLVRPLLQKLPFAAIAAACLWIAYEAKKSEDVFVSVATFGIEQRAAMACYGACFYLEKTVVPAGITIYYPVPPAIRLADPRFAARAAAALAITAAAILLRKRCPGLLAAWVTYLAILAPNLGLFRIGDQIAADRYSYLPMIGFTALVAGALVPLLDRRPTKMIALASVVILALLTIWQTLAWRDSLSLWSHAAEHGAADNATVTLGLGLARSGAKDFEEAERLYRRSIELAPQQARARINLGLLLFMRGDWPEGIAELRAAVANKPDKAEYHRTLGFALFESGQWREAQDEFWAATQLDENFADAHARHAVTVEVLGHPHEAGTVYALAASIAGDDLDIQALLARSFARRGLVARAEGILARLAQQPGDTLEIQSLWAESIFRAGRPAEALRMLLEVAQRQPDHAPTRARLAQVLQALGHPMAAAKQAELARRFTSPPLP